MVADLSLVSFVIWLTLISYAHRLERATGLAFRFVIGHSKDKKKTAELEKEVDKYKDFILINVDEENAKFPYKT